MLLELAHKERFIARKASDGEPFFVAALLGMTTGREQASPLRVAYEERLANLEPLTATYHHNMPPLSGYKRIIARTARDGKPCLLAEGEMGGLYIPYKRLMDPL